MLNCTAYMKWIAPIWFHSCFILLGLFGSKCSHLEELGLNLWTQLQNLVACVFTFRFDNSRKQWYIFIYLSVLFSYAVIDNCLIHQMQWTWELLILSHCSFGNLTLLSRFCSSSDVHSFHDSNIDLLCCQLAAIWCMQHVSSFMSLEQVIFYEITMSSTPPSEWRILW